MRLVKIISVLSLIAILVVSCSQKQEDAAELEKQLTAQGRIDTTGDTIRPLDKAIADSAAMAVPDETAETETTMPAQPAGEGYTVQVASCESEDYAIYLIELYTSRGYEPYVSQIDIEGQTYYRVRIGLFETYTEAEALKDELADLYSVDAWIDQVSM